MMNMRNGYKIFIATLFLLAIAVGYIVYTSPLGSDSRLGNAIQSAAVIVALLAAIIALSSADPKAKKVKVTIKLSIDPKHIKKYPLAELPDYIKAQYEELSDPLISNRVQFGITNTSGFTLKKPTLMFRLPLEKQHPDKKADGQYILTFRSNLFYSKAELRLLDFADTRVLSNSNLPFWNDNEYNPFWIRMLLNDGKLEPFEVDVSVNCENAEGITKKVRIDPKCVIRQEGKDEAKN
jgi:hypothetical protein